MSAAEIPPQYDSKLGFILGLDNNALQNRRRDEDLTALAAYERAGWFEYLLSDGILGEISKHGDPEAAAANKALAEQHPVSISPLFMLDVSRSGGATFATDDDLAGYERMWVTCFHNPQSRSPEIANYASNRADALHVYCAWRSGALGFVTLDKTLQAASHNVKKAFNDFVIWSPEDALNFVERQIANYRIRNAG